MQKMTHHDIVSRLQTTERSRDRCREMRREEDTEDGRAGILRVREHAKDGRVRKAGTGVSRASP